MALINPPPWVSVNPFDFINAASTGARLGLERAGLATNAQDAANRLQLGYAQLAAQNANAGQRAGAEAAAQALDQSKFLTQANFEQQNQAIQQQKLKNEESAAAALDRYRTGELGVRQTHEANNAIVNRNKQLIHVGDQIVDIGGGVPKVVFSGAPQINPYERMEYQEAIRRYHNAQMNLNKLTPTDTGYAAAQKEAEDAKAEYDKQRAKHQKSPFAADALNQPWDQIPPAWTPPDGLMPSPPMNSQSGQESQTPPDDGSFTVGKYKVTPIPTGDQ